MNFNISKHAKEEIERREIPLSLITSVLENPEQIVDEYDNKRAYQSRFDFGDGKIYLLRIIVIDNISPMRVITAYKTRKIKKYWREA